MRGTGSHVGGKVVARKPLPPHATKAIHAPFTLDSITISVTIGERERVRDREKREQAPQLTEEAREEEMRCRGSYPSTREEIIGSKWNQKNAPRHPLQANTFLQNGERHSNEVNLKPLGLLYSVLDQRNNTANNSRR